MTDQTNQVSLEEVRVRFLEAETRLADAATAVGAIQEAAERLGSAREGLGVASARLGDLAGGMGDVAASLVENATHLREGVDAIKAGDPAEIKRQIEELDSAFTAMQSVVGDRLTDVEQQVSAVADASSANAVAARRELRVVALILGGLIVLSILVALIR
jgi:hypothetical protein